MKPKIIIFEDSREIAKHAAQMVAQQIKKKPSTVLGLPTGKTVIPLYEELAKISQKGQVDFSKVKTFNLDEYLGLKQNHKTSFHYFMDKNLFKKIKIKEQNIHFLNGAALNIIKECKEYEQKIKKAGGLDLTILGLGVNGHIAFNEPGSDFNSRTREIVLAHETRQSNFGLLSFMKAPARALTIGIADILESKKIILIATGPHKAQPVKEMLKHEVSTKCPASVLQKHNDVLVLLDKDAAKFLKEKA